MSDPRFSVIMPTHGNRGFAAEAAASVLAQTVEDLELLVVDDAGDEPPELPDDPRVRLLRRETNGGAGAARNTGLAAARGRFVAFVDDDDLLVPDRLAMVAELLEEVPIVLCRMAMRSSPELAIGPVLSGDVSRTILRRPIPNVGVTAVRADLVPAFDEGYRVSEDVEWWIRLASLGPVRTVDRIGLIYRDDHDGERLTRRVEARLDARLRILDQHADHFRADPVSAAYHWRRAGGMAATLGDRRAARAHLRASLRARFDVRTLVHLARTLVPGSAP